MIDEASRRELEAVHESTLAATLFLGRRWFERPDAPEPTTLPHLARLAHDYMIADIWNVAQVVAFESGP